MLPYCPLHLDADRQLGRLSISRSSFKELVILLLYAYTICAIQSLKTLRTLVSSVRKSTKGTISSPCQHYKQIRRGHRSEQGPTNRQLVGTRSSDTTVWMKVRRVVEGYKSVVLNRGVRSCPCHVIQYNINHEILKPF